MRSDRAAWSVSTPSSADVAGVEQIVVEVEQYSYDVEKSVRMSLDYLMEAPFVKASYSK